MQREKDILWREREGWGGGEVEAERERDGKRFEKGREVREGERRDSTYS